MRPLIVADPMLRAPRPEMVSESTFCAVTESARVKLNATAKRITTNVLVIDVSLGPMVLGSGSDGSRIFVAKEPLNDSCVWQEQNEFCSCRTETEFRPWL